MLVKAQAVEYFYVIYLKSINTLYIEVLGLSSVIYVWYHYLYL